MATKTVVCPECGAPAGPGRYACSQCGALLAVVGMQPRELTTLEPRSVDAPGAEASATLQAPATFMDDARSPMVVDPGFDAMPDLGLSPDAAIRTPAGTYLPPSAVLPPLDGPSIAVAGAASHGTSGASNSTALAGATGAVAPGPAAARRGMPSLGDVLGGLETPAALTRRAIGVGAGLAAISFLLPWINGLPGAGLNGYLDRWGLAGPGLWIVFLAAAAIGAIALSGGRPATWPVGVTAVVFGGLLAGLIWPSVFLGGAAIGVWFALVGALILLVGGILDQRARHGSDELPV